jgi:uncharacterized protein
MGFPIRLTLAALGCILLATSVAAETKGAPVDKTMTVLYVEDQDRATTFYGATLDQPPVLHVPGMTEFTLTETSSLGLMPETGIRKLLGDALPDPAGARGVPRAELYLLIDDPVAYLERARLAGARILDEVKPRDWGDRAGYCLDPDGHVLAFAAPLADH